MHYDMLFLDVQIGALLCFLNGFGIAVPYLFIRNIQLGHQLYNYCTRLRPTKTILRTLQMSLVNGISIHNLTFVMQVKNEINCPGQLAPIPVVNCMGLCDKVNVSF